MKIAVNIKKKEEMPYNTYDDYYIKDDTLVFDIVGSQNDVYTRIMLVHALVEQILSEAKGISSEAITAFDLSHNDCREPGEHPDSPYKMAHLIAKGIEMLLCANLGIDWREYENG